MRGRLLVASTCLASALCAGRADGRPANGLIAYWSESPFPSIWSVRADGSNAQRVLRNRQNAKRPRVSPDGALIAFDGAAPGKTPMSDFDIQVVRPDGTGRRTLTSSRAWDLDAAWSPDGRRLSFSRQPPHPQGCSTSSIWTISVDGTGARRVVAGCGARWAPDGRRLVYTSSSGLELRITSLRGGPARTVAQVPAGEGIQAAAWSPDGTTILFSRVAQGGYDSTVSTMRPDGTQVHRLGPGFAAAWSPDGTQILLTRTFDGPLVVMDADGTHRRALGVSGADPSWG